MTNLSLAVFSLQDFNFISQQYPTCLQLFRKNSSQPHSEFKLIENPIDEVRTNKKTTSIEAIQNNKGSPKIISNKTKKPEIEIFKSNENINPIKEEGAKNQIISINEIKEEKQENIYQTIIVKNSGIHFLDKFIKMINHVLKNLFWLNLNRFIATTYSTIYIPLYLSFENLGFEHIFEALEIYCIFIYLWSFGFEYHQYLKNGYIMKKKSNFKYFLIWAYYFYNFLLIIPFCFIFDKYQLENRRIDLLMIILSLLRLINFQYKLWILSFFKNKIPALFKILQIIVIYIDISHTFACLFIVFGKFEPNFNHMWFVKIPAPQTNYLKNQRKDFPITNESIYLHALYWSYVTSSHIGIGDVCPITWQEKLYGTLIMIITTFTYISFFGNMAALFQELVK